MVLETLNQQDLILFIALFAVSLAVLLIASDKFVEGAEELGLSLGIPSFIVGVTIVAFGTSLPELATSIASVFSGSSEIVLGNVVGSNITNILLVVGATAVIGRGITIEYDIMSNDIPMLIVSAFLIYFSLQDLHFSWIEASVFLAALVVFLANSFKAEKEEKSEEHKITYKTILMIVVGAFFVFVGATYTIEYLEKIAVALNVPNHIIAVTAVALGTSLPEVVVSVTAAKKGQHGMAVGNVLGSNIFNTYAVMAVPSFFGVITVPQETLANGIPLMVAITIVFAVSCLSRRISQWEGWLYLVFYAFFIALSIQGG